MLSIFEVVCNNSFSYKSYAELQERIRISAKMGEGLLSYAINIAYLDITFEYI